MEVLIAGIEIVILKIKLYLRSEFDFFSICIFFPNETCHTEMLRLAFCLNGNDFAVNLPSFSFCCAE